MNSLTAIINLFLVGTMYGYFNGRLHIYGWTKLGMVIYDFESLNPQLLRPVTLLAKISLRLGTINGRVVALLMKLVMPFSNSPAIHVGENSNTKTSGTNAKDGSDV